MANFIKRLFKKEKNFFFMAPALVWQVAFFVLPLLFIGQLTIFKSLLQDFTWDYFAQVIHHSHFFVIFRSLKLATVTACICLCVGYPVAYFLALHIGKRYKSLLLFLITLPFLTNLLVQIYAWYFILEKQGVLNKCIGLFVTDPGNWLNSSMAMYLVMFHIYVPFMIMPLYSTLEKINIRLIEASLDLGASYRQTFFRVIFPLSIQGIKTGFFLVYVTSFGEYVIPSLLGGQKDFYVGTLISEYFFIGRDWHVGAAFTFLSSAVFIVSVFWLHNFLRKCVQYLQRM